MFELNNTYPLTRLNDFDIKYVSLISKYQGKWVICHLKDLDKWDCPGGGIEPGETPLQAAKRELWEEVGAVQTDYYPLYIYEILSDRGLSYGVQYFCNIKELAEIPDFEMDKIELVDEYIRRAKKDAGAFKRGQPASKRDSLNYADSMFRMNPEVSRLRIASDRAGSF